MKNITKNNKQTNLVSKIKQFFSTNGWEPLPYQIESWESFLNGTNSKKQSISYESFINKSLKKFVEYAR